MEPQGYPMNDPGNRTLLTGAPQQQNRQRLEWALTRITGYAGATGALGSLRGERFAAMAEPMGQMLRTLAGDGLLYVDPRPGAPPLPAVWSRSVDVIETNRRFGPRSRRSSRALRRSRSPRAAPSASPGRCGRSRWTGSPPGRPGFLRAASRSRP